MNQFEVEVAMTSSGYIIIPDILRDCLNWDEHTKISIIYRGEYLILQQKCYNCVFCGGYYNV